MTVKALVSSPEGLTSSSFHYSTDELRRDYPREARSTSPSRARPSISDLRPLDLNDLEPLPPSDASQALQEGITATRSPQPYAQPSGKGGRRISRSSASPESASVNGATYAARYVTVSAILSRSGAAIPIPESGNLRARGHSRNGESLRRNSGRRRSGEVSPAHLAAPPRLARRRTFSGDGGAKKASNGSALEALSALLLRRDSVGKVSNLSFTPYRQKEESRTNRSSGRGLSRVSKAWLHGVKEAGAARFGVQMPDNDGVGYTIAQRRARKQGFLLRSLIDRIGTHDARSAAGEGDEAFITVGTDSRHPTFEVGRPRLILHAQPMAPPSGPKLLPDLPPDLDMSPLLFDNGASASHSAKRNTSVFGIGSAFALTDPPDAPPSPIAMPGAWIIGGSGWNSNGADWREEGALLLPPPLLDDFGSDAKSFEGLLGVKRLREQEKARKQLEKLKARNRPAHKIGMLTAFSNFVKAAHAADKASKAAVSPSRPSAQLSRRHTEPIKSLTNRANGPYGALVSPTIVAHTAGSEAESEEESEAQTESSFEDQKMRRSSSHSRRSMESSSRQLNTVYEGLAMDDETDSSEGEGQSGQSISGSHKSRRSSTAGSRRSSWVETITARKPSLLPVRMTYTAPTTPFLLDPGLADPMAERDASAPPTPRLAPTLLSLPPSPWVNAGADEGRNAFAMHLSMVPTYGPPGTPRLAPTALEIAPSPFPMSPSYSPFARPSKSSMLKGDWSSTPTEGTSPLSLSPRRSPIVFAINHSTPVRPKLKISRTTNGQANGPPSGKHTRVVSAAEVTDTGKHSASETSRDSDTDVESTAPISEKSPSPRKRSFLLWFLFGDLGLGTRSTIDANARGLPLPPRASEYPKPYTALLGLLGHFYGFSIFILAHLVDLGYRVAEFLSMAFWFVRWMVLNMTGQTVLARCIFDAFDLIAKEWQKVSLEDHEGRGMKVIKHDRSKATVKGLSRWQVIKGMIELFCLQDVTRERYLAEGAGLEVLQGWKSPRSRRRAEVDQRHWVDLGAKREADRRKLEQSNQDASDDYGDEDTDTEESDDEMVVTRQGPDILEFTKTPKYEPRSYFQQHAYGEEVSATSRRAEGNEASGSDQQNRQLVKTIKWASRLAISAYGLHVTLVDLPATFTPSGNRFSRQTFAHLSRLHHEDVLHADIQTLDSDTYSPTFYLVRDLSRKVVVVSVRGTQSLQDIIVDLEMVVDEVQLSDDGPDGEKLFCHAGVLRAAKALISRKSTFFRNLSEALREHPDFGIVFTGHSLGGAIASTVVLLLCKYVKGDDQDGDEGVWMTHDDSGLPAGRTVRAITFAHPATVNANLANRAARGKIPLVLSVVLGSDIIPRCGHGQARELRRVLGGLSRVRRRKEFIRAGDEQDDARVHIVTSWWRWRGIKKKGEAASKEDVQLARRIENDLWALRRDVENDLYAAVKQRSRSKPLAESSEDGQSTGQRSMPPSPWVGPDQRQQVPLHQLASRRQELDSVTLQNEESVSASGILVPAGKSILIYKSDLYQITSPLSFFSLPDFHLRMFAEHFPSAYETAMLEDIRL